MTDTVKIDITAQLRPCPACHQPLVIRNDSTDRPVTFWTDGDVRCMTAHTDDCELRGKALPPPGL